MSRNETAPAIVVVEEQSQIEQFCERARVAGCFAFDTEFVMEDRFESELCLVQLATSEMVAIIDPFLPLELGPVWALVCDPAVETVVHAGQEDLGLCVQHTGRTPRNIFDVQVAAGLAGYEYPLSLQRLVQTLLQVRLHKSKTLTDWRRRPLGPAQISYAAEDVRFLPRIRQELHTRLARMSRLDWAGEEFAGLEDASLYTRAEEERLLRIKGIGSLKGRQLAIARDLLLWREGLGQRYNRPVRAVLKDHLLVEIARHELATPREIRELRGINLGDRDVQALCQTVSKAMRTPRTQWPQPPPRPVETPDETALAALLTAVLRGYAEEQRLAYSLLATKDSILELVRYATGSEPTPREQVALLNGWRGRTVGELLEDILTGKRMVRVTGRDGRRALEVTRPN